MEYQYQIKFLVTIAVIDLCYDINIHSEILRTVKSNTKIQRTQKQFISIAMILRSILRLTYSGFHQFLTANNRVILL